jgi:hypothetical protein
MSATYTVVTLDGQEHSNLDAETVKEWFLTRKLREDSFVLSSETGEWKLLRKVFDVSFWVSQRFGNNNVTQQQQFITQQYQQQPQQQQWQPQSQPTYQHQMPPQQQMYPQPMPMPVQQPQYYPQQTVNQYPQQQWVSQQNWVAPPPPVANSVSGVIGVFESASSRAWWAMLSLKFVMAFTGAVILINAMTIISPPDLEAIERGQMSASTVLILMVAGLIGLGLVVAFTVTIIMFLMWLHRAYKNLQAFGIQTDFTPGWAVGWWFVPFMNLARPHAVMKELWEKSETRATQQASDSSRIGLWWACYLGSGIIAWAANIMSFGSTKTETIVVASAVDIVSRILLIAAAVMIIKIIKTINEWHEGCAAPSANYYQPQNQYSVPRY